MQEKPGIEIALPEIGNLCDLQAGPYRKERENMKKLTLIVALAVLALIAGSCSSTRYIVDSDTRHDFGGYSTYAWFQLASPPDKAKPPTEANTILTRRIRWAIDGALAGKGLNTGEVGDADFLVTYSMVLQSKMVMYHTGWSMPMGGWGWGGWRGGGWGGGWSGGRSSTDTYTEGTIVVDVLDTKTRTLVWRGIAENAFTKPNPDDEKVAKIIGKVMQDFPPA